MDYKTELVKRSILQKFKSIREFSAACGIPYTTIKSALDKGIGGTSVENVIKMCDTLHLDISKLQKSIEPSLDIDPKIKELTEHEEAVILAYRGHASMQPAVDRLLGLDHEDDRTSRQAKEVVELSSFAKAEEAAKSKRPL